MGYIIFVLGCTLGFVVGILFGRRNTKKVEAAITAVKEKVKEVKEK